MLKKDKDVVMLKFFKHILQVCYLDVAFSTRGFSVPRNIKQMLWWGFVLIFYIFQTLIFDITYIRFRCCRYRF
jgi:hypothetical protein